MTTMRPNPIHRNRLVHLLVHSNLFNPILSLPLPLALALALLLGIAGCRDATQPAHTPAPATPPAPIETTVTRGHITVTLRVEPSVVDLADDDLLLTIETTAPTEIDLTIPPLDDRLQGFIGNGFFDDEPTAQNGTRTRRRHYRLTPMVADEYRIAPLAITYLDHGASPAKAGWLPTPPIVLPLVPLLATPPSGHIRTQLAPVTIAPAASTIALVVAAVLAGLLLLAGFFWLLRHLHYRAKLAKMTPIERAMAELEQLLRRKLPEHDLVKDFYVELTMVVRRYIERQHHIHAPTQTTEEFLAAALEAHRFSDTTMERLRAFLESADFVKFAGQTADAATIDGAIGSARDYILNDAARDDLAALDQPHPPLPEGSH